MADFIRVWIARNREVLSGLALLLLGLTLFANGVIGAANPLKLGVGGIMILVSLPLIRRAAVRLWLTRQHASGVVIIDERRVGYFGPDEGGFLESDALLSVHLQPSEEGPAWCLTTEEGRTLIIPVGAEGAEGLYDLFNALPRFKVGEAFGLLDDPDAIAVPRRVWAQQGSEEVQGRILPKA